MRLRSADDGVQWNLMISVLYVHPRVAYLLSLVFTIKSVNLHRLVEWTNQCNGPRVLSCSKRTSYSQIPPYAILTVAF